MNKNRESKEAGRIVIFLDWRDKGSWRAHLKTKSGGTILGNIDVTMGGQFHALELGMGDTSAGYHDNVCAAARSLATAEIGFDVAKSLAVEF